MQHGLTWPFYNSNKRALQTPEHRLPKPLPLKANGSPGLASFWKRYDIALKSRGRKLQLATVLKCTRGRELQLAAVA